MSPKYSMAGLRTLHLPLAPVFHCKWTLYALFSLSIEGELWGYKQKCLLQAKMPAEIVQYWYKVILHIIDSMVKAAI